MFGIEIATFDIISPKACPSTLPEVGVKRSSINSKSSTIFANFVTSSHSPPDKCVDGRVNKVPSLVDLCVQTERDLRPSDLVRLWKDSKTLICLYVSWKESTAKNCNWKLRFQAQMKKEHDKQEKSIERMRLRFAEAEAKKQSRQIQMCSKLPPAKKRSWSGGGGPNLGNTKGSLMKKSNREVKNRAAMKNQAVQRNRGASDDYSCMSNE
ncbi:hypothetical protein Leryth_005022 [Lithospermum erythrorhizon]|nr:hypothetical protein Leryth_005022 [Lithospermum erythrorhizon]